MRATLGHEPTGHDWWHADRVRKTAVYIASCEYADVFTVELAALLHDIKDYKFSGSIEAGPQTAEWWLRSLGVDHSVAVNVADIIRHMSYLGAKVEEWPLSLEGQGVQDGDRLDAIGAIGIARTFAYGGYVQRPIHDPHVPHVLHKPADEYPANQGTTINHFHEKLFLVRTKFLRADRVVSETRAAPRNPCRD